MPHVTVEYSANLKNRIDIVKLIETVHQAALRSGVFEVAAVRTRAACRDHYVIADGHPDNAFVAISVRVAPGRPPETRRRVGQEIFEAACEFLKNVYETTPLAISLEVQEIDNTAAFRKKNLDEIVRERAASL
jgi:5-carboxymethyl-2-hydroxymuconate isomerase